MKHFSVSQGSRQQSHCFSFFLQAINPGESRLIFFKVLVWTEKSREVTPGTFLGTSILQLEQTARREVVPFSKMAKWIRVVKTGPSEGLLELLPIIE